MKKVLLTLCFGIYLFADATIFVYHRFGDGRYPSTNTPIQELKEEFAYFQKKGYEVIPLKRLVKALKTGEDINPKWVVLTIDDSYESFYENGLPLFKQYGYPFTLFVQSKTTQYKSSDYMSVEQVKDAARYGEIGCHSHNHYHLPTKTPETVREDTQKCVDILSQILGEKPKYYAYPYGEYNDEIKKIVKEQGFEAIMNQSNGSVSEESDRFDLYRVALVGNVEHFDRKFNYKFLRASWQSPRYYPKDGVLEKIEVELDPSIKQVQVYVSGHGWTPWIKAKNGKITKRLMYELDKDRVRVFIKDEHNRYSSKILTKGDRYVK